MTDKFLTTSTRRTFCRQAASLAMTGPLAALLEGCSSPTSPTTATTLPVMTGARGASGITVAIDSSPLAAVGSMVLLETSAGDFLVAHTAQNTFAVLTATCTHQVCTITGYSQQDFVCPCHGSTFDTSGRVVAGPAPTSLRQYPAQFSNGVLTIVA
jgi:cytochrome b6-f complex iron-sulfur subunit